MTRAHKKLLISSIFVFHFKSEVNLNDWILNYNMLQLTMYVVSRPFNITIQHFNVYFLCRIGLDVP